MIPDSYSALRHSTFGKPEEVLSLVQLPLLAPGSGEVLVRMLYSSINPSDLGMIGGSYGRLRDLPAVAGREGVGEVVAIGEDCEDVAIGDLVRLPEDKGVWREYVTAVSDALVRVPADIDPEAAAGAFINPPTAVRLLQDFELLSEGDWVIQNAANSAVGLAVIGLARSKGIRTVNIVRRDELIEPLLAHGADVVINEASDPDYHKRIREITDHGIVPLGLNSVGGDSVIRLIRSVSEGGSVVTFGGMVGDQVRFPTRYLVFNDIHLHGFWMDRWIRTASVYEYRALMDAVWDLFRKGVFIPMVAETFALGEFAEALLRNAAPRLGKVLFRGPDQPGE